MTGSPARVLLVNDQNLQAAKAFLERFPETSLFLLSNIRAFGTRLGDSLYSGNLKGIEQDGQLNAVFCLTRGGTLLAQTAGHTQFAGEIIRASEREAIPIRGVLGEWRITKAIWDSLLTAGALTPTFVSKEVLYRLELQHERLATQALRAGVRMLAPNDHEQWAEVSAEFQEETHLPIQGTPEERQAAFTRSAGLGHWWGAFHQERLVSIAAIIAQHDTFAQVGAVFTSPAMRGQGLSRAVMSTLISDSISVHQLGRLFLFTGEENAAARQMYESLGFESFGHFGLFFGEPNRR